MKSLLTFYLVYRCISDHGREARFPFLDEDVVSFLNSLPVWLKVNTMLLFETASLPQDA